ncbi:hypothetical protein ACFIJ5_13170 [Haloimpatiens sp. FM7330]|uniref:hypothetical protein n=1 Tax=Haloimpatiens sp. FM7330 TaxID=3298610 RepID=UPI0036283C20
MKKRKDQIILGIILLITSALLYALNYAIFRDVHHIFMFMTEDLAFIPIEILVVTLIIDRLIEHREKKNMFNKLNMIIGIFFDEIGNDVLKIFTKVDPNIEKTRRQYIINNKWMDGDYKKILKDAKDYVYRINIKDIDLKEFTELIWRKRDFFIRLLQNQVLLEHETFTELLQAMIHLQDELKNRRKFGELTKEDIEHLRHDMERVYGFLSYEWLVYMRYLQNEYPYLFMTALINNPYDNRESKEIEENIRKLQLKNYV